MAIRAVPSTAHGMMKFPVEGGIVTIFNTVVPPMECHAVAIPTQLTPKGKETAPANWKLAIHPSYSEHEVAIGGTMSDKGRDGMCTLLKENLDVFAWEPKDMTGVPRSITEHKLQIRPGSHR